MPRYTFENKDTGEEIDCEFSISEMESFLSNNPNYRFVFKTVNIADAVRIGVKKPPSDFQKFVLGKVAASNKGAKVEKRWQINKEI